MVQAQGLRGDPSTIYEFVYDFVRKYISDVNPPYTGATAISLSWLDSQNISSYFCRYNSWQEGYRPLAPPLRADRPSYRGGKISGYKNIYYKIIMYYYMIRLYT